ncbi:MAG: tetratricopeptide repeat protein, partial [Bacteroidota bacterium]|nr:tetratricopeptide repeat protein [Bacteroidota bacterium]
MIKGKEYCKWIDHCYFLIGKSHFYKRDYLQAIEAFDYVVKQYKDSPIKYEDMLWMARTYIMMKNYDRAQNILDFIQDKVLKTSKDKTLIREFPAVYADFHISQENYQLAITHLNKAIEVNKNKKEKERYKFILAQIYQKAGNFTKASTYYNEVIKMNPPYEMAFNAKINMARCFNPEGSDSKEIRKILTKMLKDEKNKDFRDQIYYTLAEISLKDENQKEAINYLKLSTSTSTKNNNQKATSFLKLGNIYFDNKDYIPAQAYLDSACQILPKDYKDYDIIINKKNTLSDLVKNLKTVHLEDSLQQLSKMTPTDRDKVIAKKIAEIYKEEERKRQEEFQKQQDLANMALNKPLPGQGGSEWYFYNSSSISFGIAEFTKKWGNRKLEDNWRLSNKQTFDEFGDNENNAQVNNDKSKKSIENDPKDKKTYLKTIPTTPEQINASNDKIVEALYNIGTIYKESLNEYEKAEDAFAELLERFPDGKYKLTCYYQLYRLYLTQQKNSKADYYKNILLTKYPDCPYSKIIQNPDYVTEAKSENSKAEKMYEETYLSYINAQYDKVISDCISAETSLKGNSIIPKFYYIKALSIGRTKDLNQFKAALNEVVTKFPNHEVKNAAQNILDNMPGSPKKIEEEKKAKLSTIYKEDPQAIHFYIMIIPAVNVDINKLKSAVSDFNTTNFSTLKLTINDLFINDKTQMLKVLNFDNKDKAMEYFNAIKDNQLIRSKIKSGDFKQFIISDENYKTLYKSKKIDDYLDFFKYNY